MWSPSKLYAQNFEDLYLWRCFQDIDQGFYVDVGAWYPNQDSVTRIFYDQGWRGINIEPSLNCFKELQRERPRDVNLMIACSDRPSTIEFFEVQHSGLSTVVPAVAQAIPDSISHSLSKLTIDALPLSQIVGDCNVNTIHFLKIDCEGTEVMVLRGYDFFSKSLPKPWVVLVEATRPMSRVSSSSRDQCRSTLTEAGYLHAFFDGLNDYYVDADKSELLKHFMLPPCVFDGVLQAKPSEVLRRLTDLEEDNRQLNNSKELFLSCRDENTYLHSEVEKLKQKLADSEASLSELQCALSVSAKSLCLMQDNIQSLQHALSEASACVARYSSKLDWLRGQRNSMVILMAKQTRLTWDALRAIHRLL